MRIFGRSSDSFSGHNYSNCKGITNKIISSFLNTIQAKDVEEIDYKYSQRGQNVSRIVAFTQRMLFL